MNHQKTSGELPAKPLLATSWSLTFLRMLFRPAKVKNILAMFPVKTGAAGLALAVGLCATAHATVITFEELPNGLTAMPNAFSAVPVNSRLTNQYLASNGVSFTSLGGFAALVDHGAGNPTASAPNIIGGSTTAGIMDYSAPISIAFFDIANTSIKAVTDFFTIQGDWFPLGTGQVFATAFGVDGTVLGSTSDTDNKIFGVSGPVLQFNFSGIHSVTVSSDNGTVGFDQLEYGALVSVSNPNEVPEPSSLGLMLAAFGAFGLIARRKKFVKR